MPQLEQLLGQLANTDKAAWLARKTTMLAAAKQDREVAQQMRAASQLKQQEAVTQTAIAQSLKEQIKQLAEVRAVLAKLTFRDPVGDGTAKDTAQGKLELALTTLRSLPVAAWDARTSAMNTTVALHEQSAVDLSKLSNDLSAQATTKDTLAASIDAEVAKLDELEKLISKLEIPVVAMTAAQQTTAAAAATDAKVSTPTATPAMQPAAKPKATEPAKTPAKEPPATPKVPATKVEAPAMPAGNEADQSPASDGDLLTYRDHVFPIFDEYCITCHNPSDASGGLDLSTHATVLQGGGSGRTLSPGNPEASRLYLLVSHKEKPTMPPKEDRIDKDLIETIRKWIEQGAPNNVAAANKLAIARQAVREQAMLDAAKRAAEPAIENAVVMPENLPLVTKAYPERPGSMRTIAASPGAPLLAVPGFHQVLLLHQDSLQELGVLDFAFGQVESLSFSNDGTVLLAAGGIAGKLGGAVLFDVRSGRELGRFGEQRDVVLSASVSPNGDSIAIGGTRRTVEVQRTADGQSLWQHRQEDWITACTFSRDGKLLASADRAGFVAVREADNGREVHTMHAADGLVADLAFSPDSGYLATAGADRSLCLYRMSDGRQMFRQQKHRDQVLCVTWRSDSHLISSGADGRILHWQSNGSNEADLPQVSDWVYGVAASVDGSRIFTADWLGRVLAFDVKTRKVLQTVTPLAVSQ